ncbi:MAG: protein kinase [Planctomycetia bacterium]|nr:protein kinase [Planctomycetia bacterium]
MPAPTPDEFWQLLVRTRLFEPGAMESLRAEYAARPAVAGDDASPRSIAAWLHGRGALTRWQARRLAAGDTGPFFVGDYRLLERHDRDGDGLLFTARHEPSGRVVSLTLLNAKRCRELDIWTEIVRRTTAANRTADPMLSRTWSLEQHEGSRFIVSEQVQGGNVADEIDRLGPLPAQQAGVIIWQIARAVAELHALGMVHGGLSLDALRREPPPAGGGERTGRVRLLQFPLVVDPHLVPLRAPIANDAEIARLARRAAYVAPELLVPGAVCDQRSDVYAIGGMFHALLAGKPPCWTGDPKTTLRQASFGGAAPLPATVPTEIATLVGYMMARDPTQRYQTAAESADAIAACIGLAVAPVALPAAAASATAEGEGVPEFSISVTSDAQPRVRTEARDLRGVATESAATLAARGRARRLRVIGIGVAAAIIAAAVGFVVSRLDLNARPVPPADVAVRPAPKRDQAAPPKPPVPVESSADDVTMKPVEPPRDDTLATTSLSPPSSASLASKPRQVVVDDPELPWASPTSGPPPTLAYLPPGAQLILLARLAEIAADDEGRLFLTSLGPAAESAVADLVKLCGGDIAAIEFVQAGWQAGGPDEVLGAYAVRFAEGRSAPAADEAREEAWGPTEALKAGEETVYQTPTLSLWVPTAERGRVLVIAPNVEVPQDVSVGAKGVAEAGKEPFIARIVRESRAAIGDDVDGPGLKAALTGDLETLIGMLDADRHLTLLGSPYYLLNTGRPVLAGPLAKLAEPMDGLFGESLQAAALSLHFAGNFYVEMDAIATLDLPAKTLAPQIAGRVDGLATAVEQYCTALNPAPYGRVLVLRLPGMLRALAAQMRSGAEDKGVVLNAYLPQHAAHNLALAAELALAQAPGATVAAPAAAMQPEPKGALEKIKKKMTLAFAKDNLERSIQMVSDEAGVPMEILGGDLQLEGITKNQSFGLEERDKTVDEILRAILAKSNPEGKLVYIIKEKDGEEWIYITTRAAVAKRGDKLPPGFEQDKPGKS